LFFREEASDLLPACREGWIKCDPVLVDGIARAADEG
jgi:hypothetical protein